MLLPVLTLLLVSVRGFGLAGELLLYVLAVVATALVGGVYPALLAALVAAGLADYFFVRPLYSLAFAHVGDVVVLLVFVMIDDLGPGGHEVVVRLPEGLPDVVTDASLLTRVIANLVAHLLRCRSTGNPVLIDALPVDGRTEIRLTSRRAVTSEAETAPTGLVPRLCADLTEAVGGNLRWEGDGTCELTAVLDLPAARPLSGADRSDRSERD